MAEFRRSLPQLGGDFFLTDGGIETTLIFLEGLELPDFSAFDGGLNSSPQHHLRLTKRGGVYGKIWTGRAELDREGRHVAPLEGGTPHAGDCASVEV